MVKDNPKRLTVHFGGNQGKKIRGNYLRIQEMVDSCPNAGGTRVFDNLESNSRSYTFQSDDGLLSMTQFVQPALLVLEKAAFEHLKSCGRINPEAAFAGHSLGEFSALCCMTPFMRLESALKTVFIRGILMQAAVPRDAQGRSGYAMVAVDPSRISAGKLGCPVYRTHFPELPLTVRNSDCEESHIVTVIDHIRTKLGFLIQLVNLNVSSRQYVCAGDKRSLEVLQKVTDRLHAEPRLLDSSDALMRVISAECEAVRGSTVTTKVLLRGKATVPLSGIDVPFHSQLLASMKGLFRLTLEDSIDKSAVRANELKGRWTPNVTGTPFSTGRDYVESVQKLTGCQNLLRWASESSVTMPQVN